MPVHAYSSSYWASSVDCFSHTDMSSSRNGTTRRCNDVILWSLARMPWSANDDLNLRLRRATRPLLPLVVWTRVCEWSGRHEDRCRTRHGDSALTCHGLASSPYKLALGICCELLRTLRFFASAYTHHSMLAVMTLNVGYFLSVLAGLFVGELLVGRYTFADDGHH